MVNAVGGVIDHLQESLPLYPFRWSYRNYACGVPAVADGCGTNFTIKVIIGIGHEVHDFIARIQVDGFISVRQRQENNPWRRIGNHEINARAILGVGSVPRTRIGTRGLSVVEDFVSIAIDKGKKLIGYSLRHIAEKVISGRLGVVLLVIGCLCNGVAFCKICGRNSDVELSAHVAVVISVTRKVSTLLGNHYWVQAKADLKSIAPSIAIGVKIEGIGSSIVCVHIFG